MYKELKKNKNNLQITVVKNRNKLSTWRPELALRLDIQVLVAAVVPFHVKVEYSFVVKALSTGAHQRW